MIVPLLLLLSFFSVHSLDLFGKDEKKSIDLLGALLPSPEEPNLECDICTVAFGYVKNHKQAFTHGPCSFFAPKGGCQNLVNTALDTLKIAGEKSMCSFVNVCKHNNLLQETSGLVGGVTNTLTDALGGVLGGLLGGITHKRAMPLSDSAKNEMEQNFARAEQEFKRRILTYLAGSTV